MSVLNKSRAGCAKKQTHLFSSTYFICSKLTTSCKATAAAAAASAANSAAAAAAAAETLFFLPGGPQTHAGFFFI